MQSTRRNSIANELMFKIIMIGDSGTGKSSLLARYIKDEFEPDYRVTIGVEFNSKTVEVDENFKVKLQIWDTAGQESFRSIVKSFYRNSAAIILVYSIIKYLCEEESKQSFISLKGWLEESRESAPKNTVYVLMGTHLDMEEQREVEKSEVDSFVETEGISIYFETSAKCSINVHKAYDEVAKQIFMIELQKKREMLDENHKTTKLENKDFELQSSSCC